MTDLTLDQAVDVVEDTIKTMANLRAEIEQLRTDKVWLRRDIADQQQEIADLKLARDEKDDDAFEFKYLLKDILDLEAECEAIGGGPGWKERRAKAYAAAWERFEP